MGIEASYKIILELTGNINTCLKKISTLNSDLSSKLNTLGNTFQDEGYSIIQGYIKSSQAKVDAAVPDLNVVMKTLIEYASKLQKAEAELKKS